MRTSVTFRLADDEMANRAGELLDSTPMAGLIRLRTHKPKGLLPSLRTEGRHSDVLVAYESSKDEIVGVGIRSEKNCYVNGQREPVCVGYLSALRVKKDYRRGLILARGYRFLHDAHSRGQSRFYLTTILEGNHEAARLLTSQRVGLPIYEDWGGITTSLINPRKLKEAFTFEKMGDLIIAPMMGKNIEEVVDFLKREGSRKQFFPAYEAKDFLGDQGLFPGLKMSDIFLAWQGNQLVGCVGVWDQSQFKSWIVAEYGFPFGPLRVFYNGWAQWRGIPSWPAPGSELRIRSVAIFCVRDDDPAISRCLLQAAGNHADKHNADVLAWSLHDVNPLQSVVKNLCRDVLRSRLFLVHWPKGGAMEDFPKQDFVPYLETGAL